ncbi:anti-sigma factor [Pseudonocardia endophytica]|uniref:Regulator of SigK n=1 Tax=Pseudonocardia endophytica TaxID=401976 RepID=A0A4R1HJB3_PSEEN|nr:anti-sigma factor [Pseudonocardia endophytica]TCK21938.1 anti-sigma-K factor rskA [Pseudonocardia endophytica]
MSEQTVGWALHSLEPDEEMAALEHLDTCDECRQLAADVAEVTSGLAEAVEQREPPARLRESIVEQAERTEQVPQAPPSRPEPVREDRGAPVRTSAPSAPRHRATTGPDTGRPGGRSTSRSRRPRSLLAVVAAVAVLAGGGGLAAYAQQMRAERDASIAQSQDIFQMVAQFDRPGAQHAFLAASPGVQPVAAVMVHGEQRQVLAVGLTPNAVSDQTYVLWGLNNGAQPQPVGTFDVRPTPDRPVSVGSATGGSFSQYAVSLEQGRVAPASPSSVIASGQVET